MLEHTENPFAVLTRLHTLLKPQGVLVVEVPNVEATCQSPKSTFHEAHLFNFNMDTLRKLGEKSGFFKKEHLVSSDAGNITMFFQKSSGGFNLEVQRELAIPGNSEHIIRTIRNHTPFRHYMTPAPYTRLYRRICQALREKRDTAGFGSGKELLDQLYSQLPNQRSNMAQP